MKGFTRAHGRLVDRQPASLGHAEAGTVLGRDVASGVEVSVQLEITRPTLEPRTRTAVVTGNVPAEATGLRGIPRINRRHRTTSTLSLIPYEGANLSKRPRMQASCLHTVPLLDSRANVGQILQHNRPARRRSGDNLLTEYVITIPSKAGLLAPDAVQMPLGALGAFGLEGALQLEEAGFPVAPPLLPQEAIVRRDGGLVEAQIDTDNLGRRSNLGSGQRHDDVQPPVVVTPEQIGSSNGVPGVALGVGGQPEAHRLPITRGAQPHGAGLPVYPEGVDVVAWWAGQGVGLSRFAPLPLAGESTLDCLCRLDAGLDVQIADQLRVLGFEWVVTGVVQGDPIPLLMLPPIGTDRVEHGGKLGCRVRQGGRLSGRRLQPDAHRALHRTRIPYTPIFCKQRRARFRCRLKTAVPARDI